MTTSNIAICKVTDSVPDYGDITIYYNQKVFQSFHYINHEFDFERFKTKAYALIDRLYDHFPSKPTMAYLLFRKRDPLSQMEYFMVACISIEDIIKNNQVSIEYLMDGRNGIKDARQSLQSTINNIWNDASAKVPIIITNDPTILKI